MKYGLKIVRFYLLIIFVFWLGTGQAIAQNIVKLAAIEHEPYIGKKLPSMGYVHELVTEVFKRVGYSVDISFYPLLRAKNYAENGTVDGFIPAYNENYLDKKFVFSDPFSSNNIGLLKKKSFQITKDVDLQKNLIESLKKLQQYRFGVVRGASFTPDFDQAKYLNKYSVSTDLQNIDKLGLDRIDFAVIDKYTAADLMVSQRPHLIGQLEFMSSFFVSHTFHVAFSKNSKNYQQLQKEFNRGLKILTDEGVLDKILAKHGFYHPQTTQSEKIKLNIGIVNNNDMFVLNEMSRQFEAAYPQIELKWKILDENTLRKRLLSDLSISDGQFDIMTIGTYEAPIWAKREWLEPLELSTNYDLQDILGGVRKGLSSQGKVYALPFYAESSMMFYREDLFQKAGLTMPTQPTYQDVKKFAAAIHNPSQKTYGICLRGKAGWGENMALITTMVNTFGGRWFDEDWKPMLDSPEWKSALTTYKELITQYGPPQASSNGFNENLSLFSNGHCGMWIDATVAASILFHPQKSKYHDRLGFTNAPVASTSKGSNWLWTWAFTIPKSSKHKKEALKFITWATSKDYIQRVAKEKGWISVPPGTRKSTYASKNYKDAAPFAEFVLKTIQNADPIDSTIKPKPYTGIQFVGIPGFPAIGHQVGLKMVEMIEGRVSVDQALRDSQRLVKDQIRNSGIQ